LNVSYNSKGFIKNTRRGSFIDFISANRLPFNWEFSTCVFSSSFHTVDSTYGTEIKDIVRVVKSNCADLVSQTLHWHLHLIKFDELCETRISF